MSKVDREHLIGRIYEAAFDPAGWAEIFDQLRAMFGGHAAIYERQDINPEAHRILTANLDPACVRLYNDRYNALNVWATSPRNQAAAIVPGDEIIAPDELVRTKFYGEWLRPQGLKHAVTARLARLQDRTLNLLLARHDSSGRFNEADLSTLSALLPHFERSIAIARRAEEAQMIRQVSLDAVHRSGTGVIVLDRALRILFANEGAQQTLGDATLFASHRGKLAIANPSDRSGLAAAVAKATAPHPEGSVVLLGKGRHADRHSVTIAPLSAKRSGLFHAGRQCLLLFAQRARTVDGEALRLMFNLTPAETRLAVALCTGATLADYAQANGNSVLTVKVHLRSLLSKTETRRQGDLIRLVMNHALLSTGH